jgi:tripeptide aminopeptidase
MWIQVRSKRENVNLLYIKITKGRISITKNSTKVISPKENPVLNGIIGYSIITTDGTTLLIADDKAGIA